ncbi:MAG: hypothetical protein ACJ8HI_20005 [Massilia sp.]
MSRYELMLFADYHQFYIQDENVDGNLSDAWTDEAAGRLLAVAPGTVGIGTVRNVDVPVTIAVLEREPVFDAAKFDQVVECSIMVQSGAIVAAGCTDYFPGAARIKVPPGPYRVRASFESLDSVSADGLEGNDHYHLQLWPAAMSSVEILKHRA